MDEEDFIFSKELRTRMSKFGNKSVEECLKDPNFFIELMIHSGISLEDAKDIFKKSGRPDIADLLEKEDLA